MQCMHSMHAQQIIGLKISIKEQQRLMDRDSIANRCLLLCLLC